MPNSGYRQSFSRRHTYACVEFSAVRGSTHRSAGATAWSYLEGDAVPALNVQFTDAEMKLVRAVASRSGKELKSFAHDVILSAANDRADRVAEAFGYVTARSTELNRRLE
jgi:hypothetical protein